MRALLLTLALFAFPCAVPAASPVVRVVSVAGPVTPVTAAYLQRNLAEAAARAAIEAAGKHLRDLRVAEVTRQDVRLEDNRVVEYRVKMNVSFKYHDELSD